MTTSNGRLVLSGLIALWATSGFAQNVVTDSAVEAHTVAVKLTVKKVEQNRANSH